MGKILLAIVLVFIAWAAMDFVIHGVILGSAYASTPSLWRPQEEMKISVLYLTVLITAAAFVTIYARLVGRKGVSTGLTYGLLWGLAAGVSMGYGTYSVQPIPYTVALVWFLGTLAEALVGGLLAAVLVRD